MEHNRQQPESLYVKPLEIERTERASSVVFRCRGSFSSLHSLRLRDFEQEVAEAECQKVILDFREVSYFDSRGLGTLANCVKKTQALQKELRLIANPKVRDTIHTTGLDKVLRLCDSLEDALS